MSQSLYGTANDNGQQLTARARWRHTASTLLQLAIVASSAVVIGIYLFPVQ